MNRKPQVDILIICYNQENYIDEAIRSAIEQSYENIKVVVADDCSTDNTSNIIGNWHQKYPSKIKPVINNKNLGITGNSNAGLSHCNGDYLVFMGGDDIIYKDKLEKQIQWFDSNQEMVLCGHNLDIINENSEKINSYKKRIARSGIGPTNWIKYGMLFGCMSLMLKKTKNGYPKFDDRIVYASDLKFYIDALGDKSPYGYVDEVLGAYRKSSNSITVQKWNECVADADQMYTILKNESNGKHARSIKYGRNYLVNYGTGVRNISLGNSKKAIGQLILAIKEVPTLWKAYVRLLQAIRSLFLK